MNRNKWLMGLIREEAGEGGEGGGGAAAAVADGGEGEAPWYAGAGFSEDVLKDESVSGLVGKYKSADDFAKGAAALSKKIGEKGIIPPGEDATPEERSEFYDKLGRPEAADKYSWKPGEGVEVDQEVFTDRMQKLHEAGLTDGQHSAVMDIYATEIQRMNETFQNHQAEIATETEKTLKEEWGRDYDGRVKSAAEVAKKFGVIDAFKESGMINNLGVIKMLDAVSRSVREDSIDGGGNRMTAQEELEAIKKHPGWNDKTHAEHRDLVKRSVDLRASL